VVHLIKVMDGVIRSRSGETGELLAEWISTSRTGGQSGRADSDRSTDEVIATERIATE
jgi:hypothetical protein